MNGSEITEGDIVRCCGQICEVIYVVRDSYVRPDLLHVNPYNESPPFGVFIQLDTWILQLLDPCDLIKPITTKSQKQPCKESTYKTLKKQNFNHELTYLTHIAYQLRANDLDAIEAAVDFLCTSSRGRGDNRMRSKLARRLKHVDLSKTQISALTDSILNKFAAGDIDEQFIDQLRLCYFINPDTTKAKATELLNSSKEYIQRYAKKVLAFNKPLKTKRIR